jgi:hypothetical protein
MIRRTTWIILAIFVILLAGTLIWPRIKKAPKAEATPTTGVSNEMLFNLGGGTIKALTIQDDQGKTVDLVKNDDQTWSLKLPEAGPADSTTVDSALSQLVTSRTLASPSSVTNLVDFGLEPPRYKFLIVLDNDKQIIVNVGKATPNGSGYYVLTSDQRILYVVNKQGLEPVIALLTTPPLAPTPTPGVTPAPTGSFVPTSTP